MVISGTLAPEKGGDPLAGRIPETTIIGYSTILIVSS